jgi:hypothetical protein
MEDVSSELRLFLESVICDYLRFEHLGAGVPPKT